MNRICRYCQQVFQPARYHPQQLVCRQPACQRLQRLAAAGYSGCYTILREHLRRARAARSAPRAFVRREPAPGERFGIDWGHFGALDDQGDQRKL